MLLGVFWGSCLFIAFYALQLITWINNNNWHKIAWVFFFTETKGFWWVHSNCCQQQRSSPFRSQKVKGISLGKLCGNMGHASKYPRYLFVILSLLFYYCTELVQILITHGFYWIYRMLEPYMYWYILLKKWIYIFLI